MSNIYEDYKSLSPSAEYEDKFPLLYEYNRLNKKVESLLKDRDILLEKQEKNQTIKKARKIMKKKIEFNKYWLDKVYNITTYTHLALIIIVFTLLLYKLL